MKSNLLTLAKFLFGWPLSILALFFIISKILPNFANVLQNIQRVHPLLVLLGILSFLGYYCLRSYVWREILSGFGHQLALRATSHRWASSELKRYIPGNIWSFLGRTVLFQELGVPKGDVAKALLFEAQLILFSAILVSSLSFSFITEHFLPQLNNPISSTLLKLGIISITFIFIFQKKVIDNIRHDIKGKMMHAVSPFSWNGNLRLLIISLAAFILFGLGYYFIISSFFLLHPNDILKFIGFFVFSLLIGLLSFITPTGLGVREGVVAFGLSKLVGMGIAGFAALFGRVVLILTELLFLLLTYLWAQRKKDFFFLSWIRTHKAEAIVISSIILYIFYFTVASFLRYDNFYTGRFDLGNMAQTVRNTTHGNIFQITNPNGTETVSRLAFHADFILILLAPFYWIWENPKMLLLIQTVVMGIGGWYIYLIGKHLLKRKDIATLFSVLFLLNPSLQRVNLYDFHAVALASTFLLACFYHLLKKQYTLFFLFAFLAGITKEQVWLTLSLFGWYIFFFHRNKTLGISIFIGFFLIGYSLISYIIPQALGSEHFALSYFSEDVDSPTALIKKTLFSPGETFEIMLSKERIDYLHQLFFPLGFLSLAAPLSLIFAAPDFAINLLSNKRELHQIYYQYTATITPFLFIAAMYGFRSLQKYFLGEKPWILIGMFTILSLWGIYLYSPLPGGRWPNTDMFTKQVENKKEIDQYLARIPLRYSVAASNNIASHLSHREQIYVIPRGVDEADYLVFMLNDPWAQPSLDSQKKMVQDLRKSDTHVLVFENGNVVIFRKRNISNF